MAKVQSFKKRKLQKNWQSNETEKILTLLISNLINFDNGNKIETFDLAFIIILIDDSTFNMYLNALINCNYFCKNIKIATNRRIRQRKWKRKHILSSRTLFTQVSHKSHVVLFKEYFDAQEVIILRCINSLVSSSEYMVKSHNQKKKACKRSTSLTLIKKDNLGFFNLFFVL